MTDFASLPLALAVFRGTAVCRRFANVITLVGPAADSPDDVPGLPESLTAPVVVALDERRYRIISRSQDWIIEATSIHVHRDIGNTFYRAIPPRPAPPLKRFFWRVMLTFAGSRAGRRLLSFVRRR